MVSYGGGPGEQGGGGAADADTARAEARALLTLVARSQGLESVPLPTDGHEVGLPDAATAVQLLERPEHVPAPVKLELVAELARNGYDREQLRQLADSLVATDDDALRSVVIEELLDRVALSQAGSDPLGRTSFDFTVRGDSLSFQLVDALFETWFLVLPRCAAGMADVDGHPALHVLTTVETVDRTIQFPDVVDPLEWPNCPIQSSFFKSMDHVTPPPPPVPALSDPDLGWSSTLKEVVDFSYGFDSTSGSDMTTNLRFVYFENPSAVGCTYDLARSVDGKINVDRGYLLAENLRSVGRRRYTTLKQVGFTDRPHPPNATVCFVWSLTQALILACCLSPSTTA